MTFLGIPGPGGRSGTEAELAFALRLHSQVDDLDFVVWGDCDEGGGLHVEFWFDSPDHEALSLNFGIDGITGRWTSPHSLAPLDPPALDSIRIAADGHSPEELADLAADWFGELIARAVSPCSGKQLDCH